MRSQLEKIKQIKNKMIQQRNQRLKQLDEYEKHFQKEITGKLDKKYHYCPVISQRESIAYHDLLR